MKKYIKLAVIALFAVATTLSAQQPTTIENKLPETWKPDLSNTHVRKAVNPRNAYKQYTPAEFSKGRLYNAVNTNKKLNTPTSATLQNNNSSSYYRSYGVNNSAAQNVTYNSPTQMEQLTINAAESTPFGDVVSTGDMMRVDRDNKPKDPAVPVGNAALPLLLIAAAYVAIKLRVEN